MSYTAADAIMKQHGLNSDGGPLVPPPEPYSAPTRSAESLVPTTAAAAPAEDPRSFTYDAPLGAEDPNNPVGKERKRYADAGISQNEAYRLLGGPRQKLGA